MSKVNALLESFHLPPSASADALVALSDLVTARDLSATIRHGCDNVITDITATLEARDLSPPSPPPPPSIDDASADMIFVSAPLSPPPETPISVARDLLASQLSQLKAEITRSVYQPEPLAESDTHVLLRLKRELETIRGTFDSSIVSVIHAADDADWISSVNLLNDLSFNARLIDQLLEPEITAVDMPEKVDEEGQDSDSSAVDDDSDGDDESDEDAPASDPSPSVVPTPHRVGRLQPVPPLLAASYVFELALIDWFAARAIPAALYPHDESQPLGRSYSEFHTTAAGLFGYGIRMIELICETSLHDQVPKLFFFLFLLFYYRLLDIFLTSIIFLVLKACTRGPIS